MERLRIGIVSPLVESVPPQLYGGTERVVSYLTEELVRQGHDVTLYASGDSHTRARLRAVTERSLRFDRECIDPLAAHVIMLDEVIRHAEEHDVIHFHIDYWHFPIARWLRLPALTTLHGRLDIPDLGRLYVRFRDQPVVSVSNAQRRPLPNANWVGNVYHGLPATLYPFHPQPGSYLAFLGRISPEKRPDRAIGIARRAGIPLKIAAKVDKADAVYFKERIEPLLGGPGVEYLGEIGEAEKSAFLGNALALLFPIDWPEPFGLSMIEAMACGTPVIAFRCGSVPEIMVEGRTGYVVDSEQEALAALERIASVARRECRRVFEERYTAARMADDYLALYRSAARKRRADALLA